MSVSLETQIYQALTADPTLTGLVGTSIFLAQLPQNVVTSGTGYPALTYQRISTTPLYVQAGNPTTQQGSSGWARFQFTFYVASKTAAGDLEALVRALFAILNNFNAWALPSSPSVVLQSPNFLLSRRMQVDAETSPPLFMAILDYRIAYQNQ